MNGTVREPMSWSRVRWWGMFALVMVIQLALVVGLSDRRPILPRQPASLPEFHFVADTPPGSPLGELLDLHDPTLFALPHSRGFSGRAWLAARPMQHRSSDWSEPPRWLKLPVAELGAAFLEFVRTNVRPQRSAAETPPAQVSEVAVSAVPLRARSTFRVEGDLAKRELLAPLDIPSMPHTDLLTNTVVQLGVNPSGFALSVVVLAGSGSKQADQQALQLARSARFKPIAGTPSAAPRNAVALTWGRLVFQWHTLEIPTTNNPPVNLSP